jgi:hypothetical protein
MKEATPMTKAIRSWRETRRFRAMVRELKALSPRDLGELCAACGRPDHIRISGTPAPVIVWPRVAKQHSGQVAQIIGRNFGA